MNIVHLSGNFVRDPELKEIENGDRTTKVVNFVVASSRRFRKKDGSNDEETTFVNCEAWDSGAETIAKWFNKGDAIVIHGSIKNESWEDKDGNKRYRDKIRVSQFEFPPKGPNSKKDDGTESSVSANTQTEQSSEVNEEAVPF